MRRRTIRWLAVGYFALLHILFAGLVWKTGLVKRFSLGTAPAKRSIRPEITDYYRRVLRYHARSVDAVPDGCVIFIGDSITQGLAVSAVSPLAVNYGIGGDTTQGVLERLPVYMPAIERAKCVVVAIGVNDTIYRTPSEAVRNYARILDRLPEDCPVITSAILPVDGSSSEALGQRTKWINRFNQELKELVDKRPAATLVDSSVVLDTDGDGQLDNSLHDGDGLHLNSAGNRAWAAKLRSAIASLERKEET